MTAAQQLIPNDVTKHFLFARRHRVADHNGLTLVNDEIIHYAGVVSGTTSTPAARLNLQRHPFIGDLEHSFRSIEQQASEIGDKAKGVDVDLHLINNSR